MWQSTVPGTYYQPIYPGYTAHSIDDILKWIDLVTYEKKLIDENTAEKLKNEVKTLPPKFTPVGVEGAKTALIQAEKEYEAISKLYPNGKVILPYTGIPADPRAVYYDWVNDRGFHGLWNTHVQYLGMDPQTLLDIIRNYPYDYWGDPQKYAENYNGVDQYITKIWEPWDLVKFVMGYERWYKSNIPGMYEDHTINYGIPQTLKAFGFPVYWVRIEPNPPGSADYEWVVSLPDYVASKLKSEI
jgi:hypothetical protein